MQKLFKFAGIGLAAVAIILLLIISYAYGTRFIAKLGRLPDGTQLVLIDTSEKPRQSDFANKAPIQLGWPVPQAYQKYAENFHWWTMNFHLSAAQQKPVREEKPTLAVVFNLPAGDIPAVASFAGKVKRVSMTQSGNGPEVATVELNDGEYIGLYEYILGPTVKEGATVQQGDPIGTIALQPEAMFPKENMGPWEKRDVIGNLNFKFSLFKIVDGGERESVWIITESFVR